MTDIKAKFQYNGGEVIINGKSNEYMKDLYKRFCIEVNENPNEMIFLCDGDSNPDLKVKKEIDNSDINILAYHKKGYDYKERKSKYIICPICKNNNMLKNCVIRMENYKIFLEECDNNHQYSNVRLDEIWEFSTQLIDESKIVCSLCQETTKAATYNNEFYKCFTCKKDYCPLCISKNIQEKEHNIVDYDESFFFCENHAKDRFDSYCLDCHKNLCFQCYSDHNKKHKLIEFKTILPESGLKFDEFEKSFNGFKKDIDNFINILNKVKNNLSIYCKLSKDIKNNYNTKNRNYQIIKSAKNINRYNIELTEEMDRIKNEKDIDKFNSILKLYNQMTNKNTKNINTNDETQELNKSSYGSSKSQEITNRNYYDGNKSHSFFSSSDNIKDIQSQSQSQSSEQILNTLNSDLGNNYTENKLAENKIIFTKEIKIRYNNNKNEKEIAFLGKEFIDKNQKKIEIYYNGKNIDIKKNYNKQKFKFTNDIIEIKLKLLSELTDMSHMFNDCSSLIEIYDIEKIDTGKVTKMDFLFCGCHSLKSLPDISNWETEKVENMKYMFGECYSLTQLPDISKWNTINVNDMSYMFAECKKLEIIPNISKWDTSNVTDMSGMFSQCVKLSKLDNLQKWDIKNVLNANYMFKDCNCLSEAIINCLNFKENTSKYLYH